MSKAKLRRQQRAREAFIASIEDSAGEFYLGFADGCEIGYRRSNRPFYVDRAAEHNPAEHDWEPPPRAEFAVRIKAQQWATSR